nr:penicillin-binding protein 2 [Nitrospiraceae bacterium]
DIARDYIYGDVASHLIGYIGKITGSEETDPEFAGVPNGGYVGQRGVERLYDQRLRGVPGQRLVEVDAMGRELKIVGEIPPKKGKDLTLALDINVQLAAEKAFGGQAGAFVAMNPETGEVLGFMSRPAFDPNDFVGGISTSNWRQLADNKDHPMLDRVLQCQYPPGSTFKIITAIAALQSGSVKPADKISCPGTFCLGRHVFHDWRRGGHGIIDIKTAIIQSCDVFFYKVGLQTGINAVARYARAFGLGRRVRLGLGPQKPGLIPDTAWKKKATGQAWYPGDTVTASIGQGYVLVTPIQMARLVGCVGTGGRFLPEPRLLKLRPGGKPRLDPVGLPVSAATIGLVRSALEGVVNEPDGTAYYHARSKLVSISGKTGTAQTVNGGKRYDAWFVAYAPSDDPSIALAVMVEHTLKEGAGAAAPVAKAAIEAYFMEKMAKTAPVVPAKTPVFRDNPVKGPVKGQIKAPVKGSIKMPVKAPVNGPVNGLVNGPAKRPAKGRPGAPPGGIRPEPLGAAVNAG